MTNKVVRLRFPPKPTLYDPYAQIKWMFFQLESEQDEPTDANFRYAKGKYIQFVSETNAYYPELLESRRFYLNMYWEVDALVRFNKWLLVQELSSTTRYSIYKTVRQVMDMAYALRVINTIVYHSPMFKGVPETDQREAYSESEQEVINAAIAKWIGLAESVVRGYQPTGEGVPYRLKDFQSLLTIEGKTYSIADAANVFGIEHGIISHRLKTGWTHSQAVGIEAKPRAPAIIWVLNGVTYQSLGQVAETFDISVSVIRYRRKKGWTPEQIVGLSPKPPNKVKREVCEPSPVTVDGQKFPSISAAANHYGLNKYVVNQRLQLYGWSVREAFELDERRTPGTTVTIEDIEYSSITKAARAYGVGVGSLERNLKKGYSPEQAVGLVPICVDQRDERALLWIFENEYGCNAALMLSEFRRRLRTNICSERRLRTLFSRWGVWPYVDDRLVMPLAVELAMLTALNVEALKQLEIDSYQLEHPLTGQPFISYRKPRSGSVSRSEDRELHLQVLDVEELFLGDEITERVHKLIRLILAVTEKIRSQAPPDIARRLFIFEDVERSRREGGAVIVALDPKRKAGHWYRRFCSEEGLYSIFGDGFNFNMARCRPTFATNMVLAGADMFQVQIALGHESIDTTMSYFDQRQLRPAFHKSVSSALEAISNRSAEYRKVGTPRRVSLEEGEVQDTLGLHETLSGCGCLDPYRPSDHVKAITRFQEGSVCKYWNMCLLCDSAVITEHSLPKLVVYRNRVAAALETNSAAIWARKALYQDVLKLIDGILEPDVTFPGDIIENARRIAAGADDVLVDQLVYQGI